MLLRLKFENLEGVYLLYFEMLNTYTSQHICDRMIFVDCFFCQQVLKNSVL